MSTNIPYIICCILCFYPAVVLHEISHGWVAYKLGDPTAKASGRLTLNPLKHVDIFGTIILPLVMIILGGPVFGYAKPVPYNPSYFKDKRKGDLLVGLAGPGANLVMALVAAALSWVLYPLMLQVTFTTAFFSMLLYYFYCMFLPLFILINLYLMFFNLLPIPPLDGSSIFAFLLPEKCLPVYYKIERYAMPVLLILLVLPYVFNVDPFGWYLRVTAYNLFELLCPIA